MISVCDNHALLVLLLTGSSHSPHVGYFSDTICTFPGKLFGNARNISKYAIVKRFNAVGVLYFTPIIFDVYTRSLTFTLI